MKIATHQRVSGLSGNEIYCLDKIGLRAGQLCVGNSVVAIGVFRGLGAGLSTLGGGEVEQVTNLVREGRTNAFNRLMKEAETYGGAGVTGVSFDLINHAGNLEFLTVGSTVHQADGQELRRFSSSADAQQLYCQLDSGFRPIHFVFGNVAYSIGLGGNLSGMFRSLRRGEVKEYSEIFDKTRHLALERIRTEGKKHGANAVIGIRTTISPLMGTQEMMMVGTASHHPQFDADPKAPITSDMTNEEMWNMVNLGYLPLKLVMGVSVYSLGLKGGIISMLQSLGGGEVAGLTEILYEAREKALERIEREAQACGADEVVGVKIRVYDLGGGLVEFMAMGTAVKKFANITTQRENLPPQAIIQDQDTFLDTTLGSTLNLERSGSSSARKMQGGPMSIVVFVIIGMLYLLRFFVGH